MTAARRPLPRRSFGRIRRSEFDSIIAALLEQCADAHTLDAQHAATPAERRLAHRMTADALRDLARDLERGSG